MLEQKHDGKIFTIEETIIAVLKVAGGSLPYGALRRETKKSNKNYDLCMADSAILKMVLAKTLKWGPIVGKVMLAEDPNMTKK